MAKYFEAVDPVYPLIHRRTLYSNYERFWAAPPASRRKADADMIALHCVMYALATQFMKFPTYEEQVASGEFYGEIKAEIWIPISYLTTS